MLTGRGAIFEGGSRTFLEGKLKQDKTWGKYFDGCKDVFLLKNFSFFLFFFCKLDCQVFLKPV